jgi:hypothetical protein
MDDFDDDDMEEPDLVQLLVLEAGKLVEDTSGEFVLTLPSSASERAAKLLLMRRTLATAHMMVETAIAVDGRRKGAA